MLIHDYNFPPFPGAKIACNEFFGSTNVVVEDGAWCGVVNK